MPTNLPEPTLEDFRRAFREGVRAKDRYADLRDGSIYDHFGGVAALTWTRQARRDADMFGAIYLDTAEGKALTNLLDARAGFERLEDTYGVGTATLRRESAAAGDGTVWRGSRLVVKPTRQNAARYVVTENVDVSADSLEVRVPIRAERIGVGVAIDSTVERVTMAVEDPLWDASWTISTLRCAEGTSFEPAPAARARFRDQQLAQRVGYADAIIEACREAGAVNAVLFPSFYAGDDADQGLNMAYVGDAGFSGTPTLVRKVQVALEKWRVLGDQLQVRPLATANLIVRATVRLWERRSRVSQIAIIEILRGALRGYFKGATGGFSYDRDAMAGAMLRASNAVQAVSFELPSSNASVVSTVGGRLNFPASLTRYQLRSEDITITFA